jgi:predicted ribosomally synthesized peptide with SipW-like signal peptide
LVKRLTLSLMLMGLAAFALGAGAIAWFSDSGTGNVSITAGTADINFDIDQDCNGGAPDFSGDGPFPFTWSGIVPGETTTDCITVNNVGDGNLQLYTHHTTFAGSSDLQSALTFRYTQPGPGPDLCTGPAVPNAGRFTSANGGRGCLLGTVPEGGSLTFWVNVTFVDSGGDQNALQGQNYTLNAVLTGYTS